MPVSALSALDSWGVYMLSSLALILLVVPSVLGLYGEAVDSGGLRGVAGIREVVDGLEPGMQVLVSYGWDGMPGTVTLEGDSATYAYGSVSFSVVCAWPFQPSVLLPGVEYELHVASGRVEATPTV